MIEKNSRDSTSNLRKQTNIKRERERERVDING